MPAILDLGAADHARHASMTAEDRPHGMTEAAPAVPPGRALSQSAQGFGLDEMVAKRLPVHAVGASVTR